MYTKESEKNEDKIKEELKIVIATLTCPYDIKPATTQQKATNQRKLSLLLLVVT